MKRLVIKLFLLAALAGIYSYANVATPMAGGVSCSGGGQMCKCTPNAICIANATGCACVVDLPK